MSCYKANEDYQLHTSLSGFLRMTMFTKGCRRAASARRSSSDVFYVTAEKEQQQRSALETKRTLKDNSLFWLEGRFKRRGICDELFKVLNRRSIRLAHSDINTDL